jgi:glycosyltransferase involved in cell wall biosynthesis
VRVAHVTSYRPDSANGVHAAAARLGTALVDVGVEVEFWHFRRGIERVSEREEPSGVRVVELPFPGVSGYVRWLPDVSRRWLRQREREVSFLHFHSIFQPEAWYVSRLIEAPYVVSPHGGYIHFLDGGLRRWARWPAWLLFERDLLRRAALVHAVSAPDADAVRKLSPAASVVVLPSGVDLPAASPQAITRESPWLFVGRLAVEDKGLDLLVDGYAQAFRQAALPRLIVRGPDYRGGRRWLDDRVVRHGLGSTVKIGDAVFGDEKAALMASCGLFVHTSRTEGLPVAPIEAMAHSRPVLVTPGTNLVDAVAGADAGFVVGEHSPEAVAGALIEAASTGSSTLLSLGTHGRDLVRREFSWPQVATAVAAAYNR